MKTKQTRESQLPANTPSIVSAQDWDAARERLLVKEKSVLRAHDALAAERRRMPWMAVEKMYAFDGPKGKVSLLDLFEGRRQLIVYRAFFEPGVFGWPEHACRGCSSAGLTAILLVMGVMDLRVMAVLTLAITAERLAPSGERVARAIGVVLVGAGLLLLARAAGLH